MTVKKTRQQLANERRWYARLWWVGFHVFGYVALAYAGAFSPKAQGTSDFITCVVVALLNAAVYVRLQTSSPGFLPLSTAGQSRDLEAGDGKKAPDGETTPVADAAGESDAELLVPRRHDEERPEAVDKGLPTATRFCDHCEAMQPMRTKHW
jgi:hypothetical protein